MKNNIFKSAIGAVKSYGSKHAPEILIGMGIGSMTTSIVMAVKVTPKAIRQIETKENEVDRELTKKEVVKVTWKTYAPVAATAVAGATCILCGNHKHLKRRALLATAYQISETAFTEYKRQTVETVGEEKAKEIQRKTDEKIVRNTKADDLFIEETYQGDTICYDNFTGRYFKSSKESIRRAVNEMNFRMNSEMTINLNELYYEMGLKPNGVGNEVGWRIEDGPIEPNFSSVLRSDGEPCLVLSFLNNPKPNYRARY